MSQALHDIFGMSPDVSYNDKTYQFSQELDLEHMGKFSLWLRERALLAVDQAYNGRTEHPNYPNDRIAVFNQAAAGMYDFGGELCTQVMQSVAGLGKVLELIILQSGDIISEYEATEIVRKKHQEVVKKIHEVANTPKKLSALVDSFVGPMSSRFSRPNRSAKRKKNSKS